MYVYVQVILNIMETTFIVKRHAFAAAALYFMGSLSIFKLPKLI